MAEMTNDQAPMTKENPNPNAQTSEPIQQNQELVVTDVSDEKLMAALAYLGFLVFIPLLTRKGDPYVQFHVKQGLVIFLGEVIAVIAVQWLSAIGNIFFVLLLIASVVGLFQSLQGRRFKIPGIGQIADSFNI